MSAAFRPSTVNCQRSTVNANSSSSRVRIRIGFIPQVWQQPALRLLDRDLLACGIILHLIECDLPDRQIAGARMREVPTADRSRRIHRERLGQLDLRIRLRLEQAPQRRLLGVIGTCGIAWRRPNASILFLDELLVGEPLVRYVAPELATYTLVQTFRECFREPIRERFEHNARIIVVLAMETFEVLLDPEPRRDGERTDVIGTARALRRDEVRKAIVRLPGWLALLLTQEMQSLAHLRARFVRVYLDIIVVDAVRREQSEHAFGRQPSFANDLLQHATRVRVQVARLLTYRRIGQNVGECAAELPRVEERHPIDIARQVLEGVVLEGANAQHLRHGGRICAPIAVEAIRAGLSDRELRALRLLTAMLLPSRIVLRFDLCDKIIARL